MERHLAALQLNQDSGQPSGQLSMKRLREGREGNPHVTLTARDEDLIGALLHRIRCIDIRLASWSWKDAANGRAAAKRRLKRLVKDGWLDEWQAYARPLIELKEPVATWNTWEKMPEFGLISYHLKTRFSEPARLTAIFLGTAKAAKRFGGIPGRQPRSSEATHDLGLASVFLKLKEASPKRAAHWISEAKIVARGTSRGVKIPDALIREVGGRHTAIEFGGEYSKQKLVAFHEYCRINEMGYELW